MNNNIIRTGVKALIVHQQKILIIKEKVMRNGVEIIIHDFPGGGIDFGENLEKALQREVFEEVCLKIKVNRVVGAWDFIINPISDPDSQMQIVCIGYQCSIEDNDKIDLSKNPAEYENIFDYKWLSKEEILKAGAEILVNQDMRRAVENLEI